MLTCEALAKKESTEPEVHTFLDVFMQKHYFIHQCLIYCLWLTYCHTSEKPTILRTCLPAIHESQTHSKLTRCTHASCHSLNCFRSYVPYVCLFQTETPQDTTSTRPTTHGEPRDASATAIVMVSTYALERIRVRVAHRLKSINSLHRCSRFGKSRHRYWCGEYPSHASC